jgi:hypothetical protein
MQPNATNFKFTGKRLKAIELVAQDVLSDAQIAEHLKINKVTLERWKKHSVFAAAVEGAAAALAEEIRKEGIAHKQTRLDSYVSDFERLSKLIEARAADDDTKKGPGGDTGLIVRSQKGIGGGENYLVVETFEFDHALIKSRLELRKQIAQELGEWEDKQKLVGPHGGPLEIIGIEVLKPKVEEE